MKFSKEKRIRIIRATISFSIFAIYVGVLLWLYIGLGYNKILQNPDELKALINSTKNSKLIFVLINLIQTTLLPIPNFITIVVGTQLYGTLMSSLLTLIGVFVGSIINFSFGKFFGKKAVYWILGKETVDKYLNVFHGREKFAISTMLLLPGFPDDIICIIAGITKMSWRYFIVSVLLFRPIPLVINAYFGNFIPLYGWGLLVWAIIIIAYLLLGQYIARNWNVMKSKKTNT